MTIEPNRPVDVAAVRDLARRARAVDSVAPFSEGLWQVFRRGQATVLTGHDGGALVAAAIVGLVGERLTAELVVDPTHRGRGHGARLLDELLSQVTGELWLWAHGDHPAAGALARRHGLEPARQLLQLRRPVEAGGAGPAKLPDMPLPDGVRLRTFVVGEDEQAWLEVNNAAFARHPEQGRQTLENIRAAEARPDFDPAGFFLAVDADDRILGFHWTKVHPGSPAASAPPRPPDDPDRGIGEVYVLGVHPSAHGSGLGAVLTVAGLRYLADVAGVDAVMLYVEADNTAAVKLYERLGFVRHVTDVAYLRR